MCEFLCSFLNKSCLSHLIHLAWSLLSHITQLAHSALSHLSQLTHTATPIILRSLKNPLATVSHAFSCPSPLQFLFYHSLVQHTSNLKQYHSQLLLSWFYAAHPHYEQGTQWHSDRSGHVLADRLTSGNAVASIVRQVLDYHLNWGLNSSYLNCSIGSLVTAKYQFLLCKLEMTPFAQDFDKASEHLEHLQSAIASTPAHCNLFVVDMIGHNVRFSRNIFKNKYTIIPYIVYVVLMSQHVKASQAYLTRGVSRRYWELASYWWVTSVDCQQNTQPSQCLC